MLAKSRLSTRYGIIIACFVTKAENYGTRAFWWDKGQALEQAGRPKA